MRKNCDIEPTREFIDEVARQLATRTMCDSELPEVDGIQDSDTVAIVQEGANKRVGLKALAQFLGETFGIDELIDDVEEALDKIADKADIKTGTTEYWSSQTGYIPSSGEIVVYTDKGDGEVPGIKIGTGNSYVQDLAFIGDDIAAALMEHIGDDVRHVTESERRAWNNKLNVDDNFEVVGTTLVFNRN